MLGGTATWGEVLRTSGFGQSPGVLYVLGIVPLLGWIPAVIAFFWVLVAVFVGVRQALDVGSGRTLVAVLIGGLVYGILAGVLGLLGVGADFL